MLCLTNGTVIITGNSYQIILSLDCHIYLYARITISISQKFKYILYIVIYLMFIYIQDFNVAMYFETSAQGRIRF